MYSANNPIDKLLKISPIFLLPISCEVGSDGNTKKFDELIFSLGGNRPKINAGTENFFRTSQAAGPELAALSAELRRGHLGLRQA